MKNHGWTYTDRVEARFAGMSLARFYASAHPHSVEAEWRARADAGEISRNGLRAAATDILTEGDLLEWRRPPWEEPDVPLDVRVVFEDADLVAVDKPAGLPVLPDGGFLENTLVHWMGQRYPGEHLVPAHRLGRGTSGLVLFSRTPAARQSLAAQFRDATARESGKMRKMYLARTVPYPGGKLGDRIEIDTPIGPVEHGVLGRVHAASPSGRPSLSRCRILETDEASTLWKVDLVTGRPHQIRIHLASIGAPLLGDPLFLPGGHPRPGVLPGEGGYFLRAFAITFRHPATGIPTTIELPRD